MLQVIWPGWGLGIAEMSELQGCGSVIDVGNNNNAATGGGLDRLKVLLPVIQKPEETLFWASVKSSTSKQVKRGLLFPKFMEVCYKLRRRS
jgi:hypothetical protein